MDLGINNKSALICGASRGIGLACATALAKEGVKVFLVARNSESLDNAVETITDNGGIATAITTDLSDSRSPQIILDIAPKVDILVTNPGGSPASDIQSGSAEWEKGINDIVVRPMALSSAYLEGMKSNRFGRIINITSAAFASIQPGLEFSGALRAALTHSSASLSRQVAKYGITVNNVAPGPVDSTGLQHFIERRAIETGTSVDSVKADRLKTVPTNRFASADEIGHICAFLASVHAGCITGRTILADGGTNAYPYL